MQQAITVSTDRPATAIKLLGSALIIPTGALTITARRSILLIAVPALRSLHLNKDWWVELSEYIPSNWQSDLASQP